MSRLPEAASLPVSTPVHDVALWPRMGRWTAAALVALGVWTAGTLLSPAQANGVNWTLGVNVPGAAIVVGDHRPVAAYPAPVYAAPVYAPVGYPVATYPVYPAPVYVPPARVYQPISSGYGSVREFHAPPHHYHHRHHRHHGGHHEPYGHNGGRPWDDGGGRWGHR